MCMYVCYLQQTNTCYPPVESLNGGDAVDLTQQDASPVQIKVEEMEEQPIAKKKRGEGRSQKKSKVMPVDETESKGSSISFHFYNLNVLSKVLSML